MSRRASKQEQVLYSGNDYKIQSIKNSVPMVQHSTAQPPHPLKDIVNLDLYPIHIHQPPPPPPSHPPNNNDSSRERPFALGGSATTSSSNNNNSVAVTLANFLLPHAIQSLVDESIQNMDKAFYTHKDHTHNVYLTPIDPSLPMDHVYNRQVVSTKGCIQTDQIPSDSSLLKLYHDEDFKRFLKNILGIQGLYPYQDPLSSINVHFASEGQELGWHFDNSAFAITLLLQEPEGGGVFEYVPSVRDSSNLFGNGGSGGGEDVSREQVEKNKKTTMESYQMVEKILNGDIVPKTLDIKPGTLVLFRGRDCLHRVTKVIGDKTRILVVLAYNEKPGVALSEEARRTFFGRTGMEEHGSDS
mmetsp:Transcript_17263/g.32684  ORF Transcript_17263/g.32684 Transcript_17263/m.32684 type:complete len:357 (-) Transcript_17263:2157-3227(-)